MLFCKHNLESFILQSCGYFSSSLNEVDRLIILCTKELMLPQFYAPKMENFVKKERGVQLLLKHQNKKFHHQSLLIGNSVVLKSSQLLEELQISYWVSSVVVEGRVGTSSSSLRLSSTAPLLPLTVAVLLSPLLSCLSLSSSLLFSPLYFKMHQLQGVTNFCRMKGKP